LSDRHLRKLARDAIARKELQAELLRARRMMDAKKKGAVKLAEQVIKQAKKLGLEKSYIELIQDTLRKYKLDTPKQDW
jgi:hypothetical protein